MIRVLSPLIRTLSLGDRGSKVPGFVAAQPPQEALGWGPASYRLEAGFVGAQPMRGESEGCPLGTPLLKGGRGRSSATAMRSKAGSIRTPFCPPALLPFCPR
jgi:hypothetical protein